MHTCIPSHGLKRSWHSCPRWVNASNKNTPSMHHPQRQNVTTSMVGLKNSHIGKNLTQNGEPQRYSWGTQKKKEKLCPCFYSCCVFFQNRREKSTRFLLTSSNTWHQTVLSKITTHGCNLWWQRFWLTWGTSHNSLPWWVWRKGYLSYIACFVGGTPILVILESENLKKKDLIHCYPVRMVIFFQFLWS